MQKNSKVILIGDVNVGKTAIIHTLVNKTFPEKLNSTLGACFQRYTCQLEDHSTMDVDIWDTAGQEKYRSLLTLYYKNCEGIILVFDVTDKKSLLSLKYWADQINENCEKNPCILMVGNKYDLKNSCQIISHEEIVNFARSMNWKFMYTSAKEKYNIDRILMDICMDIKTQGPKISKINTTKVKPRKKPEKDSCC